ncbi:OmpA family protein [Shewanella sp. SR44-3]|uniref:OmpA family protein n=1 Tax=unclassified Shewanella TaxID=196818 RepID=UPI0015FC745C|nr:OmpA family protein [Shewanella sp. SR44-3]MBB1271056.1 OmpA family protein [Shewanella sp. SR44-3]
MNKLLVLLMIALTAGCATNDLSSMDTPTKQKFDLNDQDRDGVIVARERCPETITGATISNEGCGQIKPIHERQELKILFPTNSYELDPQYYGQIELIANMMKQYPGTTVTIEGHCSKKGSHELNMVLSQNRANTVTQVLSSRFGIASSRLKAIGYSFDRPVDMGDSPESHRRNRRVIAEISGEDTAADMKWNIYTVDQQVN